MKQDPLRDSPAQADASKTSILDQPARSQIVPPIKSQFMVQSSEEGIKNNNEEFIEVEKREITFVWDSLGINDCWWMFL